MFDYNNATAKTVQPLSAAGQYENPPRVGRCGGLAGITENTIDITEVQDVLTVMIRVNRRVDVNQTSVGPYSAILAALRPL